MIRSVSCVCVLSMACAKSSAQQDRVPWPPRGYACVRTQGEILIDGVLESDEWGHSAWSDEFIDILGDRKPVPRHSTRMRMMWDNRYLYVAAELEEPHLWATLTERDSIIFHDNDFEVFIDPSGDTHMYNEIEINAHNTVWDLLLVRTYDDGGPAIHGWDIAGLRHAVRNDGTLNDPSDIDRGWTVEMAIPWEALAETAGVASPPTAGDRWRMNFSRVQWQLDVVDGAYVKRADPEKGEAIPEDNWVWSEQRAVAMHEPEYWGIVEFRIDDDVTSVEPTDEDLVVWGMRQVFNEYRKDPQPSVHELDGLLEAIEGFIPPDGWSWPPSRHSLGERWSLECIHEDGERAIQMHEDGRIERGLVPRPIE